MKTETTRWMSIFLMKPPTKGPVNGPARALDLSEPLSLITESVLRVTSSSLKSATCCRICKVLPGRKRNRQAMLNLSRKCVARCILARSSPMRRASQLRAASDGYHWDPTTARLLRFSVRVVSFALSFCRRSLMLTQKTLVLPICLLAPYFKKNC